MIESQATPYHLSPGPVSIAPGYMPKLTRGPSVAALGSNLQRRPSFAKIGAAAMIDLIGAIDKRPSVMSSLFGFASTQVVAAQFAEAMADEDVDTIVIRVDSPGGSVDGLAELGDQIFAARGVKQVIAQVDGLAASAAYYLASQADRVVMGRMDVVGSIGTKLSVWDMSGMFEEAGVEVLAFDTGPLKSAGETGTQVTDEQKKFFQGIVDTYFEDFLSVVARGRAMDVKAVRKLADGGVLIGQAAVDAGLVDGIATLEQTLSDLAGRGMRGSRSRARARLRLSTTCS